MLVIIIGKTERNSNQNYKLEFQFCAMCPKLFILKEFYFLILESNVGPYHKYSFIVSFFKNPSPLSRVCALKNTQYSLKKKKLLSTKTKESRINK